MRTNDKTDFEYEIIFVSVTEFSELMRISEHVLYHMIERGRIAHLKLFRSVRIPVSLVKCDSATVESDHKTKKDLRRHFTKILKTYEPWLTIDEMCEILSISRSTAKRLLATKEISYFVWHGTVLTFIEKSSFIEFIVNHIVTN